MKLFFYFLIFCTLLSSCQLNPFDCSKILSGKDLINEYGNPSIDTIVLKKNPVLYEYQYGLTNYFVDLKEGDTVRIIEKSWIKEQYQLVVWYELNNDSNQVDCLTWNKDEVKF